MLDKTDATRLLTRIRRQWFAKRKSIAAILKEVVTNESSALIDSDAHNKAMDADAALQELGADVAGHAYVTATVTVWDGDAHVADKKLRLVEKVIQGRDGLFLSMPSRRKRNGEFKDVAHPLNNETRRLIEERVLAEYRLVVDDPTPRRPDLPEDEQAYATPQGEKTLEEVQELHLQDSFWSVS